MLKYHLLQLMSVLISIKLDSLAYKSWVRRNRSIMLKYHLLQLMYVLISIKLDSLAYKSWVRRNRSIMLKYHLLQLLSVLISIKLDSLAYKSWVRRNRSIMLKYHLLQLMYVLVFASQGFLFVAEFPLVQPCCTTRKFYTIFGTSGIVSRQLFIGHNISMIDTTETCLCTIG